MNDDLSAEDSALLDLLGLARRRGYGFITPTPATHARVVARPDRRRARSIEDVLGWNLPFEPGDVDDDELVDCLHRASGLDGDGIFRSRFRIASLHDQLYLHSSFPTESKDSVFLGPDSYRFADLIRAEVPARRFGRGCRIADIGTGAGIGAVVASVLCNQPRVFATDVNRLAVRLARINLIAAGTNADIIEGFGLDGVPGPLDLITINPPYIIDECGRTYRNGGRMHGGEVSLDLAGIAMASLASGGCLILYTGSAIVEGHDAIKAALGDAAERHGCKMRYREIDPDVFGEELDKPQYADVDRIAAVAAMMTRA